MFIICDLDGTLADVEHRRHHVTGGRRNWPAFFAACTDDPAMSPVVETVRGLADGSGLRPGDRVLSVNGVSVTDTPDAVAKLVAAPAGAVVVAIEPGLRKEPPPGAPPGGAWVEQKYCGPKACWQFLVWGWVCESDVREVYLAPDGRRFLENGKQVK